VGPELRIDNIPDTYPLKDVLLKRYKIGHAGDRFILIQRNGQDVKCAFRKLDTTFGMYRRDFKFKRLNPPLLTYQPYIALHLDWYIDPQKDVGGSNLLHESEQSLEPLGK